MQLDGFFFFGGTSIRPWINNQFIIDSYGENMNFVESIVSVTYTKVWYLSFQYSLVYEIIGEYPAQSFFGINNATGQISVIQDLRLDGLQTTQYKVLTIYFDFCIYIPDLLFFKSGSFDFEINWKLKKCRFIFERLKSEIWKIDFCEILITFL